MADLTKLGFISSLNYMKRSEFVGNTDLTLPVAGDIVTHTVTHDLGYVPFFIVGAEQVDNTTIWSGNYVNAYTLTSGSPGDLPVQLNYWSTDTALTIELTNGIGTGDQEGEIRTVYWVIYLDYQNA